MKPLDFMKVVRDHQRLVHLKVHVVSVGVRDKLTDLEQLEEVRFNPSNIVRHSASDSFQQSWMHLGCQNRREVAVGPGWART